MLANHEQYMRKIRVAEVRILRWMCGKTRKDRIGNMRIWENSGVASIGDKSLHTHLGWFGPMFKKTDSGPDSPMAEFESTRLTLVSHKGLGQIMLSTMQCPQQKKSTRRAPSLAAHSQSLGYR